jgi:hypothetical protein
VQPDQALDVERLAADGIALGGAVVQIAALSDPKPRLWPFAA